MASLGFFVLLSSTLWLPLAVWLLWLRVDAMRARKRVDRQYPRGVKGTISRMRGWKYMPLVVAWGGFGIALPLAGGILFQSTSEIISLIGIITWQDGIFSQMIISILFTMVMGLRFGAGSGGVRGRGMTLQGSFWRGLFGSTLLCCAMTVIPYLVTLLFVAYSLHHSPPPPANFDPKTMLQVRDLNLLLRKTDAAFLLLYWTRLMPLLFLFAVVVGAVVRSRLIGGIAYLTAMWPILQAFWVSATTEVSPGDIVVQNFPPDTRTVPLAAATAVCLAASWLFFTAGWRPINVWLALRWVGRKYMGSR